MAGVPGDRRREVGRYIFAVKYRVKFSLLYRSVITVGRLIIIDFAVPKALSILVRGTRRWGIDGKGGGCCRDKCFGFLF